MRLEFGEQGQMTKVTILPVPTRSGGKSYFAVAGNKQSFGHTAGEALDALTVQLEEDETSTPVILQHLQPDVFFDAAEQQRLGELMERWRAGRNQKLTLSTEEQAELEKLIEAELLASAERTKAILDELTQ